ncbi:MAG TPA: branched-chain amino acid ABC transporter permease [Mycobacteriales bacterium]|jgi:branched-chain amino acid transport system permease protein
MALFLQLAQNGAIIGLLYGLFAYGMSLIISTTGVLHFAHGFTLVGAAYTFWWLYQGHGIHPVLAAVVALAAAAAIGVVIELGVYRPLRRRNAGGMVFLVASLAVLTLGQNLLVLLFGTDPKPTPPSAFMSWTVHAGPLVIRTFDVLVVAASLGAFAGLYLLQTRTAVGLSFRAVGDNPERAETLGIRLQRTYVWVFVAGSVVAALPAVLLAVQNPVTPSMGFDLLVKAVIALVIGGVGSMPGALLGGVLIGLVESLAVYKLPTQWAEFTLFAVLFLFVVVRPNGLSRNALRSA